MKWPGWNGLQIITYIKNLTLLLFQTIFLPHIMQAEYYSYVFPYLYIHWKSIVCKLSMIANGSINQGQCIEKWCCRFLSFSNLLAFDNFKNPFCDVAFSIHDLAHVVIQLTTLMYDFNKMLHQVQHNQWLDDTRHIHVKADKLLLIQHLSPIGRPPWCGINKLWVYLGRCAWWVLNHCPPWAHCHYGLKSYQPVDNCDSRAPCDLSVLHKKCYRRCCILVLNQKMSGP